MDDFILGVRDLGMVLVAFQDVSYEGCRDVSCGVLLKHFDVEL